MRGGDFRFLITDGKKRAGLDSIAPKETYHYDLNLFVNWEGGGHFYTYEDLNLNFAAEEDEESEGFQSPATPSEDEDENE